MKAFSTQRLLAIFIKEFQQMMRDRLTFAMAIGVPILQLVLFGYAINTDRWHAACRRRCRTPATSRSSTPAPASATLKR